MNCCYNSKILAFKQLLCICTILLSPFWLGETAICRIPQVFVCSTGLNVEGKIKKIFGAAHNFEFLDAFRMVISVAFGSLSMRDIA